MIGELAELLGVSRDTLRIYEEQGLLKPMRDENGFRVYSEENICRLVGIRFYRESLLPIKSVRQLMEDLPAEEKLSLLEKQIEEEKRQAERHLKNVARLEITKSYYRDYMQETGSYELRNQEESVIISEPRADYFEAMCDYFALGKQDGDMTHCYLNAEYDMDQDCRAPERTCLILKASELRLLGREELLFGRPRLPACRCLYTVVDSPGPFPSEADIRRLHDYGRQQGLKLTGRLNTHFLYQYEKDGVTGFHIAMYAPLAEGSEK